MQSKTIDITPLVDLIDSSIEQLKRAKVFVVAIDPETHVSNEEFGKLIDSLQEVIMSTGDLAKYSQSYNLSTWSYK